LPLDLAPGVLPSEIAGAGGAGLFPSSTKLFLANSHQNSHSPKIKMAAKLAASHLADFIGFLAPQVKANRGSREVYDSPLEFAPNYCNKKHYFPSPSK
jgi:hypothetical protein